MVFVRPQKIVLISCASKKLGVPSKARDLYISTSFKFNLAYAESLKPDAIFILSAKHGLLPMDQIVAPYDETLNGKGTAEIKEWAERVLAQLRRVANLQNDEFIILAGRPYRRFIMPRLRRVKVPLARLAIGMQLQFLKRALTKSV